MKKVTFILCIVVVILLITALYSGVFSLFIYLLSLIPLLSIKIYNWISVLTFSLCIIVWIVPYELINFLQDIPLKNKFFKNVVFILTTLLSVFLLTLYILYLDERFINLSFSNVGIIGLILIIMAFSKIVNMAGNKLKDGEKNNK